MAIGTPDYLAPEQLAGAEHTCCVDWWSLGCVLFEFCYGAPPFHADTPEAIFSNVLNLEIQWPDLEDDVSPDCKDLIKRLLHPDPELRLGANNAHEIKLHPWFKDLDWDSLILQKACFIPAISNEEDTTYFQPRKPTSAQSMAKDFSANFSASTARGTQSDASTSAASCSLAVRTCSLTPARAQRAQPPHRLSATPRRLSVQSPCLCPRHQRRPDAPERCSLIGRGRGHAAPRS